MNVFRSTTDSSDAIDSLKNELLSIGTKSNDDMCIKLAGYCHNHEGFILQVTNMERITDTLLSEWKSVIRRNGYSPDLQYDFQDGWVNMRCMRVEKKPFMNAKQLQLLGYISLAFISIYAIWYRRNKMLQK